MSALLFLLLAQGGMGDLIESSDLKGVRRAIEGAVAKDDERAARALVGGLGRARRRIGLLERELENSKRSLERARRMAVGSPEDRRERLGRVKEAEDRIHAITQMLLATEEIYEVVRGAFRSLRSGEAVATVGAELEGSATWLSRCEMADALGVMGHEEAERRLRERLEREPDPLVIGALLDALAARGKMEEASVRAAAAKAGHKAWMVQIMAARALGVAASKRGVGPLIEALAGSEGRAKNEICVALKGLTKVDHGGDPVAWTEWWQANREDFLADRYNPAKPKRLPGAGRTAFFEVPVLSRRPVFVIDRSGSMRQRLAAEDVVKIELARAELKQLFAALPDGVRINLVFFGDKAEAFSPTSRLLSGATRRDAVEFMDRFEPEGGTNVYEALERALAFVGNAETGVLREDGLDTIFILSDGAPTEGRISHADILLRRFTRLNRYLRAAIHTISFGETSPFLTRLSALNDGTSKSR